jgi:Ras family
VNRFINNGFSPYYDPTQNANVYKKAFNMTENTADGDGGGDSSEGPSFVEIEIIDLFPHDHPILNEDTSGTATGTPGQDGETDQQLLAKEMVSTLNAIVKNSNLESCERLGVPASLGGGSILGKIHGYIYVYDCSNRNTFDTLSCLIDTVREIEKSERRGKRVVTYTPKKLVLGNKKDLLQRKTAQENMVDRATLQKLEINKHRLVSAMTNHGVQEAIRALINEIHSCNILHKELFDEEKKRDRRQPTHRPQERRRGRRRWTTGDAAILQLLCRQG